MSKEDKSLFFNFHKRLTPKLVLHRGACLELCSAMAKLLSPFQLKASLTTTTSHRIKTTTNFSCLRRKKFRHNEMGFYLGGCSLHFPSRQMLSSHPRKLFTQSTFPQHQTSFMVILWLSKTKKNRNKVWAESFHIEPRQGFASSGWRRKVFT